MLHRFQLLGLPAIQTSLVLILLAVGTSEVPGSTQVPQVVKVADALYPLSVSPDGRLVAEIGTQGNLAIRDMETGDRSDVTKSRFPELVMNAAFSPGGERIAFAWHNDEDHDDVRVIRTDGSDLRVLYRDPSVRSMHVKGWSPDGKQILTTLRRMDGSGQIALVPVTGGSPKVVSSWTAETQELPKLMAFSPSGKFIAYDAPGGGDGRDHDIFLLTDGDISESPLVEHPADDRLLGWSEDDEGIVFASDRSGTVDVWLQPLSNGMRRGRPRLLVSDVGQLAPLGFSRDHDFYFGKVHCDCHVYVGDIDVSAGRLIEPLRIVDTALHNSGAFWSPDGGRLAFIRPVDHVVPTQSSWDLVIRAPVEGVQRKLQLDLHPLHQVRPVWSPDGRTVLLKGWDRLAYPRELVVKVDVLSAEVTVLLSIPSMWKRLIDWPVWTSDGAGIYYTEQTADTTTGIFLRVLEADQEVTLVQNSPPPFYYGLTASPDGAFLAFGLYDSSDDTSSLAVLDLGTREMNVLAEVALPALIGPPAWFPNSDHLLYQVDGRLLRIPKTGGAPQRLGDLPSRGYNRAGVSIHPNGQRIAFVVEQDTAQEIWVIRDLLSGP